MANMTVNPTRMELNRLKIRLRTAKRGHKLLKDKQDELVKRFIDLIKRNKALREEVEQELAGAFQNFLIARAVMSGEALEEAVMFPTVKMGVELSTVNVMSVIAPRYQVVQTHQVQGAESPLPYGYAGTSGELDKAVLTLTALSAKLLELAEVEKTCQLMAGEIEKTRRRVNALEHVMIPQFSQTIKAITMKLDENERSTRVRLMKVKDIVAKKDD